VAGIKSKSLKTAWLLQNQTIRPYVPETVGFSNHNLHRLLYVHKNVFIKPDTGRFGLGVIKAMMEPCEEGYCFWLCYATEVRAFKSFAELHSEIEIIRAGTRYIAQQGIDTLCHDGRPFDVRIMVQISPQRRWRTTGYVARVAAPGRIVTNFHAGGTPHALAPLLKSYISQEEIRAYIFRLCRLGEAVAAHCHKAWPNLKAVGLDIAVDREMRPWILEVNTMPLADLFAKLKDKTMYRRICRFAKAARLLN